LALEERRTLFFSEIIGWSFIVGDRMNEDHLSKKVRTTLLH